MEDKDDRVKSNQMWIKWTKLKDKEKIKHSKKWFKKPNNVKELIE